MVKHWKWMVFVFVGGALAILAAAAFSARKLEHRWVEAKVSADDVANSSYREVERPVGMPALALSRFCPVKIQALGSGEFHLVFERTHFGTLELRFPPCEMPTQVELIMGETLGVDGRVLDPASLGQASVRSLGYLVTRCRLARGDRYLRVVVPQRFRPRPEILPEGLTGVLPFRFVRISGLPVPPGELLATQLAVHHPLGEGTSSFRSSDSVLDEVWDLSRHTVVATSFAGLFVDGNRERRPYEADAYINQLGQYAVSSDTLLARYSQEYLFANPNPFTEWAMHSILLAHADYFRTGDKEFIRKHYKLLKAKTLMALAREDGLISTDRNRQSDAFLQSIGLPGQPLTDLVDWPESERDDFQLRPVGPLPYVRGSLKSYLAEARAVMASTLGYRRAAWEYRQGASALAGARYAMPPVNTVVNEFHAAVLGRMAYLADAIGENSDAVQFRLCQAKVHQAILTKLVNPATGLFVDGEGSSHASLHANLFALAFGLVPPGQMAQVVAFVKAKGMACSVYGAQYLLEGLFQAGEANWALSLMTAKTDRSWWNMVHGLGSSMTLEAWNRGIKPNMDWSHAWGAAPLNIIPRWVMGVRPLIAGYSRFLVEPRPGHLTAADLIVPLPQGKLGLGYRIQPGHSVTLNLHIPVGTSAETHVPLPVAGSCKATLNGRALPGSCRDGFFLAGVLGPGRHRIQVFPVGLSAP